MFGVRKVLPLLALAVTVGWALSAALAGDEGFVSLFNGKDLTGWKWFVKGKDQDNGRDTFTVKDGEIVVSGLPDGYFYTDKSYKNYIVKFDWKFFKDGNSGLLVHITGDRKVWPKCVEVQGLQKDHGNILAVGGAKGKFKKDADAQKKAIKFGDWNTTEVLVKDGEISSKVNGIPIASGTFELKEGPLGFQSEGQEVHFKNIKIKVLE